MPLFGKTDALASIPKYLEIGRIVAINVLNGGSGYTNGATVAVTITGSNAIAATATAVVSGGVVQSITLTSTGAGYSTTSLPVITMATGTGLTCQVKVEATRYNQANILFCDDTEASLLANKGKGIPSPGWWNVVQQFNSNGDPRWKTELLAVITSVTAGTGDHEEDVILADVDSVFTISAQPANQSTVTGGATFAVTASVTGGGTTLYQWELAPAANPTAFAPVVGATSASIVLSGKTSGNTGDMYRVVLSGAGAKTLVSNAAKLTFGT